MTTIVERAVRLETELADAIARLDKPTRIYRPAPFRPARRVTGLEARLLAASNALTATKVEHLQ